MVLFRESKRKKDFGQKYWICKRYRAGRYRNLTEKDCTNGSRLTAENATALVSRAWNDAVDILGGKALSEEITDPLMAYRMRDLKNLIKEYGHLDHLPHSLVIRVLDHLCIEKDGQVEVVFLSGARFFHPCK